MAGCSHKRFETSGPPWTTFKTPAGMPAPRARVMIKAPLNWDDMKFFLEVARTERLSDAAKSLQVDISTVSRRIHALEESLDVILFSSAPMDIN